MPPFTTLCSRAVVLLDPDVDTDQIVPAQCVNVVGRDALAAAAFARRREQDPGFVFNRPEQQGRALMFVGANFGCGSSREAAAWALAAWGIRALLGLSFNATFRGNCLRNGLLPLTMDAALHRDVAARLASGADPEFAIDLPGGRVEIVGEGIAFAAEIEPFARDLLVRGVDELQYLMDCRERIKAYETRRGGQ